MTSEPEAESTGDDHGHEDKAEDGEAKAEVAAEQQPSKEIDLGSVEEV